MNGLLLLKYYLRDKPKLEVKPIHPEVYQWWFQLPAGTQDGKPTRKYGFLCYVGISNKGLRKCSLNSWRLSVRAKNFTRAELKPISLPELKARMGSSFKLWPVLGQRDLHFEGDTVVEPGTSISGMAYYIYHVWGDAGFDPRIIGGEVSATLTVTNIFGQSSSCRLRLKERPLIEIQKIAPGIERITEPTDSKEDSVEAS